MKISESPDFTNASWQPYSANTTYTLSPGYGVKTVYIQLKDTAGNVSTPYSSEIHYELGKIQTVAGSPKAGLGDLDDTDNNPDTHLGRVSAMSNHGAWGDGTVLDGDNLYWADDNAIKKYSISTGNLVRFVGDDMHAGYKNGKGQEASFNALHGGMTKLGHFLYVADANNYAIRQIDLSPENYGNVTTLTGPPPPKPEEAHQIFTCNEKPETCFVDVPPGGDSSSARMYYLWGNCLTNDGTYIYICDSYNHAIRRVDPKDGSITTIAGASPPTPQSGKTDGPGSAARFYYPFSLFYNPNDHSLIIADSCNSLIRKLDLTSKDKNNNPTYQVTTVTGTVGHGFADGDPSGARFPICAQRGGGIDLAHNRIILADGGSGESTGALRAIDLTTYVTTTIAGGSGTDGKGFADGIGLQAKVGDARGPFANDGTYMYFSQNGALRRIDLNTSEVKTIQGTDPGFQSYADGQGSDARFSSAMGFTSDGQGNIYMLDTFYNAIRKMDIATWTVTTIAGTSPPNGVPRYSTYNSGYVNGIGSKAKFNFFTDRTFTMAYHDSKLYVADTLNCSIRQIDLTKDANGNSSYNVTTIAGPPPPTSYNCGFVDGEGTTARFYYPSAIVYDDRDSKNPYLYVADHYNSRIRKIDLNHNNNVTTLAGSSRNFTKDTEAMTDGTGTAAKLFIPTSMELLSDGKLYFNDYSNTIRRVDPITGVVETVAGSLPSTLNWYKDTRLYDFKDGIGTNARFRRIDGLVSNIAKTALYIMDYGNSAIRKYDIKTGEVTTIVGNYGNSGKDQDGFLSETITPYPMDGIMVDATHLLISEGKRLRLITLPKE